MTFGDTAPTVTAPSGAQGALSYSATLAVCTVGPSSGALTQSPAPTIEVNAPLPGPTVHTVEGVAE